MFKILDFILFDVLGIVSARLRRASEGKAPGFWDRFQIHQRCNNTDIDLLHQGLHWVQRLLHSEGILRLLDGFLSVVRGGIRWHLRTLTLSLDFKILLLLLHEEQNRINPSLKISRVIKSIQTWPCPQVKPRLSFLQPHHPLRLRPLQGLILVPQHRGGMRRVRPNLQIVPQLAGLLL